MCPIEPINLEAMYLEAPSTPGGYFRIPARASLRPNEKCFTVFGVPAKIGGVSGQGKGASQKTGEPPGLSLVCLDPWRPDAQAVLREYFGELISRYNDRPAEPEEILEEMELAPSEDLFGATGVFIVAYRSSDPVGCVGLRFRSNLVGQVTRMFVIRRERRRGVGVALLSEIEMIARRRGITRLELDTRNDLVEARRLYLRSGYQEVPAFNAGPYAEHWFAKLLT
jgi:GNAT superfamily N-acetyltransferase